MTYPIPFSTQEEETMSSAESSSPPSPSPSLSPSPSPSASTGLHRMDDLRKVFARYDADGDGRISASELADVLRSFGSDASPAEVRGMIAEMDADGDGFVDLQEFADFHRRRRRDDGAEERELREAFDVYDLDRNGLISAEELHRVLRLLGEKCSVKDCSRMIRSFDDDGDGSVNFEEFKKMMTNGGVGGRKSSTSGRGGPSSSAA